MCVYRNVYIHLKWIFLVCAVYMNTRVGTSMHCVDSVCIRGINVDELISSVVKASEETAKEKN